MNNLISTKGVCIDDGTTFLALYNVHVTLCYYPTIFRGSFIKFYHLSGLCIAACPISKVYSVPLA